MRMIINALINGLLILAAVSFVDGGDASLVNLKQGKLRGFKEISSKGREFHSFLAIPYAEPPLEMLKFKDPIEHEGWKGERNATQQGPICSGFMQIMYMKTKNLEPLGDPDCLFVNVHTPRLDSADLPVMVFFHGGAYMGGSANFYEPHEFLNEDVILVTVNYRLGVQGFLSTEDDVISGNFGLKDQTMALLWVNKNIQKFGGDPKAVTIFGQSAGGGSTHFHLLSEKSQGLFSKAIVQAGSLLCPWAKARGVREAAIKIGHHFNCFEGKKKLEGHQKSLQLLECLRNVDDKALTKSISKILTWTWFPLVTGPHVDGNFLKDNPEILMKNNKQIDTMFGVTKDEGAYVTNGFLAYEKDRQAILDDFSRVGPLSLGLHNEKNSHSLSKKVYEKFIGGIKNSDEDLDNLTKMFGDRHFGICTDWAALAQAESNEGSRRKVFYYELHHRGQRSLSDPFEVKQGGHWVSHADELFYLFPMSNFGSSKRNKEDSRVSDIFVKTFTNFAKTGNPTPDDSLGFVWEEFTRKSPKHLKVQPTPVMEEDTRKEVREFWSSLPTFQNKLLFGDSKIKDEF